RFTGEDPLWGEKNPYSYVHNGPSNAVDPTGRSETVEELLEAIFKGENGWAISRQTYIGIYNWYTTKATREEKRLLCDKFEDYRKYGKTAQALESVRSLAMQIAFAEIDAEYRAFSRNANAYVAKNAGDESLPLISGMNSEQKEFHNLRVQGERQRQRDER